MAQLYNWIFFWHIWTGMNINFLIHDKEGLSWKKVVEGFFFFLPVWGELKLFSNDRLNTSALYYVRQKTFVPLNWKQVANAICSFAQLSDKSPI